MTNFVEMFSYSPYLNPSFHPKGRLQCARDIAKLCFMLAKHIDALDLNLGAFSMHKKRDTFVNTQESARNHLDLNREIIYRLNLDSSVAVEIESTRNANVFPSYRKLGSIIQLCAEEFFHDSLIQLIAFAFGSAKNKEKLAEWLMNLETLRTFYFPIKWMPFWQN
ncbi:hypothetical protein CDAR_568331 [Caerostris darwini]|uniref:Uncharacterized protein n=1 Tax=Caerostris darwini TaxID=1538125 RepID=A0AAV4PIF1_9ARAC|nr:hypothetical protein CDAR_568331 [Caerostris darwini]